MIASRGIIFASLLIFYASVAYSRDSSPKLSNVTHWPDQPNHLSCCGTQANSPMLTKENRPNVGIDPYGYAKSLLPSDNECGVPGNDDRIIGGTLVNIGELPWLALLQYEKPYGWDSLCGGVLISRRYVLTAAHCVKSLIIPPSYTLTSVRLGEWNISNPNDCVYWDCAPPPQDIPIEQAITHEDYHIDDENMFNDLSLLRLAWAAQISDYVKPICLPLSDQNTIFEGYSMLVAGWGYTEHGAKSDVPLKVTVPVVNLKQCCDSYQKMGKQVTDKHICAGGKSKKDSCRGDSGGPLMAQAMRPKRWVVVGVVSYGVTPCGLSGWPGVYTRIGAYIDWILSKLRP